MRFRYCDEVQASLCKCADSPEPSLAAHEILIIITMSSDYTWHYLHKLARLWRACTFTQACLSLITVPKSHALGQMAINAILCQKRRLWRVCVVNSTKSPFDAAHVTKAKVSLCKCADSQEPSLIAQNSIKSPFESARDF